MQLLQNACNGVYVVPVLVLAGQIAAFGQGDFTLAVSSVITSIDQGQSTQIAAEARSNASFTGTGIFFEVLTPLPAGVTVEYFGYPNPVLAYPNFSSLYVFGLSIAPNTQVGAHSISVRATGGGITRTASLAFTVVPGRSISLSVDNPTRSVQPGGMATYTLTAQSINGYNFGVDFGVAPIGQFITTRFLPDTQVVLSANGSASVQLEIRVGLAQTPATRTFEVFAFARGLNTVIERRVTLTLTIQAASDISLTSSAQSISVAAGHTARFSIQLTSVRGYNGFVNLSYDVPPSLGTLGTATLGIAVSPAGPSSSIVEISTLSTAKGAYPVTIQANAGLGILKTLTVNINVGLPPAPSFSVSLNRTAVDVKAGNTASLALNVTALNGFQTPISLSVMGLPSHVGTASLQPSQLDSFPGGSATSELTIVTRSGAPAGSYTLTLRAAAQGFPDSILSVTLQVAASQVFSLTVDPASRSVTQGESATFRVTIQSQNGFNAGVLLSLAGPAGFGSATFSPNPITPAPDGLVVATLTLAINRTAQLGAVALTVRGSAADFPMRESPIALTVNPGAEFLLSSGSTSVTVPQGQTATFILSAQGRHGFSGPVTFSATGLTFGNAAFDPNPAAVALNGTAGTTLTITTTASTPTGSFPFTVRAVSPNAPDREQTLTLRIDSAVALPTISEGGIVNAAGFQPGLSRGTIAALFGSFLTEQEAIASDTPLPRVLGGTRVRVNGQDAPLFSIGPRQINFQVPLEAPASGMITVMVVRDGTASRPLDVAVAGYAPGIFVYERAPALFDPVVTHSDGSLVTPEKPAAPDSVLVIYGSGIGDLTEQVRTGEGAPNPPAQAAQKPVVTLGAETLVVEFAGLTPGSIGLAQFNVKMPKVLPAGAMDLPLQIRFGSTASQIVRLAVGVMISPEGQ